MEVFDDSPAQLNHSNYPLTHSQASKFDKVWGIGFDAAAAVRTPKEKWGQNLLGKALMNVRERIRKEMEEQGKGEGKEESAAA